MNRMPPAVQSEGLLGRPIRRPLPVARRVLFFAAAGLLTTFGISLMFDVLRANGIAPLETVVLVLFAATFTWISTAFCSAVLGFFLNAFGIDPLSLRRRCQRTPEQAPLMTRTAIVMPIHNEDVTRVVAGLEATHRDLERTGLGAAFDFYLLSDSTDPEIAAHEERAFAALASRTSAAAAGVFYRRRTHNEGRKAGNVADFCRRWGAYYECMVVLDADSIMSGTTLCRLVRVMQANPSAGIVQTVPQPIRQRTPFGRALEFASTLYSPMLATGLSFWQTDAANYWGHNAIVRIEAFMKHCGLPVLPGAPPLGGEILSHDFVEAALMRRAGWEVLLLPELSGSFEEVPGNMLDYAKRDRRWSEGNLQHLRLLTAHALHPLSRLHFLFGAFAYACSFLWLLMLAVSSVDAIARAARVTDYFASAHALFPDWPVSRTGEMWSLLAMVVGMLLLPKLLGVVLALMDQNRRRAFGGGVRLFASATLEMVLSVVIAPIMMSFHAYFVVVILLGGRVRWDPQSRDGRQLGWRESFRSTAVLSVCGVLWGTAIYLTTPIFFWTLTPVLLGLVLAAPLVRYSSRAGLGRRLHRLGFFLTGPETVPEAVLCDLRQQLAREPAAPAPADFRCRPPPPSLGLEMPAQRLRPEPARPPWGVEVGGG